MTTGFKRMGPLGVAAWQSLERCKLSTRPLENLRRSFNAVRNMIVCERQIGVAGNLKGGYSMGTVGWNGLDLLKVIVFPLVDERVCVFIVAVSKTPHCQVTFFANRKELRFYGIWNRQSLKVSKARPVPLVNLCPSILISNGKINMAINSSVVKARCCGSWDRLKDCKGVSLELVNDRVCVCVCCSAGARKTIGYNEVKDSVDFKRIRSVRSFRWDILDLLKEMKSK